jgi:hypothetical protein
MWNLALQYILFFRASAALPRSATSTALELGSAIDWSPLNESLHGRLLAVRPTGAPCHDPDFSADVCSQVNASWGDAFWRADQPGGYMALLFESPHCLSSTPRSEQCAQGYVPVLAADVRSEEDVVNVVNFVKDKDVSIRIKNTGHDLYVRHLFFSFLLPFIVLSFNATQR